MVAWDSLDRMNSARALVEGWRITLSDGRRTWVYRTDSEGRVIRLQNQTASANCRTQCAVLEDASQRSGCPFPLYASSTQNDGLGQMAAWDWALVFFFKLSFPAGRVIVGAARNFVYHTGESGGVRFDR